MMSKLNAKQRSERDNLRFAERVSERRENGGDVVGYALKNGKARKFLTETEKKDLLEREKWIAKKRQLKDKKELEQIDLEFRKMKEQP